MYSSFFGLDAEPFRVNPDPHFLYFSDSHREALATLVYAVQQRKGFIVLTGEVGTGKTTLLNALLEKLDPAVQAAYLFNTKLTLEDFFSSLFDELELEPLVPFQKSAVLHRLNHYLIERLRNGRHTLLVIDEAQNLSVELLEEIRMLSNLETPRSKLLQIMLVGQPELDMKLAQPELRQLRQRVELRHTIRPLSAQETMEYVRERLLIAGHDTGDLFTGSALRAVYRHSAGIPRVINVICDNALLAAFVAKTQRVSTRMVEDAARDMDFLQLDSGPEPPQAPAPEGGSWIRRLWSGRRAQGELGA